MTDEDILICRSAIKRIAWLETKEERQAALSKYEQPLRGVIERGVYQIFPVVQRKRAERKRPKLGQGGRHLTA